MGSHVLGVSFKKNSHVSITTHLPRLTSCFMRRMRQSRGQHILETPSVRGVQVVGIGFFKKAGNKFSKSHRIHVWYTYQYIYHKNQPNVGKYIIHRWCGDFYKNHVGHSRNLPPRIVNNNGRNNDEKCMATKILNMPHDSRLLPTAWRRLLHSQKPITVSETCWLRVFSGVSCVVLPLFLP